MTTTVFRAHNFNAGPAALPLEALQQAQAELLNFGGTGMSLLEMSHRSKEYEAVHNKAIALLRELLDIPAEYEILFLQGGGSTQFAMVPMNFLPQDGQAGYVLTGAWAEKACEEAAKMGSVYVAASAKDVSYRRVPAPGEISMREGSAYLHITSNNTIYGTAWQSFPDTGQVPLIADMSSDILSRPFDVRRFALIYAGAQKNMGPAGVTIVIIRRDLLGRAATTPTMLSYNTYAKDNSLYNTPPAFSIYIVSLVLEWIKTQGGLSAMEQRNREKAALIYDAIDGSGGFYKGHAEPDSRSLMNITFRLANEDMEKEFLNEAKRAGFVGLAGHRSVGGCRASAYNAVPLESCQALRDFMLSFRQGR